MNKSSIIILAGILAVLVYLVFQSIDGSGSYSTFADAAEQSGQNVTIIGQLNKSKEIIYDPEVNANRTEFYVIDSDTVEQKVIFHDAKPRDIEKSEEITMEGRMIEGEFHAVHILLKCPSKYETDKIGVKEPLEYSFEAPIPE
ncbi:MAG: cytochrome c-type biogenesis protein CcmE [Glaciecola sp.]|jgi:cytochrome c-type biogenesis protein CcmE